MLLLALRRRRRNGNTRASLREKGASRSVYADAGNGRPAPLRLGSRRTPPSPGGLRSAALIVAMTTKTRFLATATWPCFRYPTSISPSSTRHPESADSRARPIANWDPVGCKRRREKREFGCSSPASYSDSCFHVDAALLAGNRDVLAQDEPRKQRRGPTTRASPAKACDSRPAARASPARPEQGRFRRSRWLLLLVHERASRDRPGRSPAWTSSAAGARGASSSTLARLPTDWRSVSRRPALDGGRSRSLAFTVERASAGLDPIR
jgi:hypothetical protein